jgi:hypothetical protein
MKTLTLVSRGIDPHERRKPLRLDTEDRYPCAFPFPTVPESDDIDARFLRSIPALREAICRHSILALRDEVPRAEALGRNAGEYIERDNAPDAFVARVRSVFEEVIDERARDNFRGPRRTAPSGENTTPDAP